MKTILQKIQPLDSRCEFCGQMISSHACGKCDKTGILVDYPGGFCCDEWRTGRYCNWCASPLPANRDSCDSCGGRGWIRDRHDCDPASSTGASSPFGTRAGATRTGAGRYTGPGHTTATKKSPNNGRQTPQGGADASWIVILALVILAITFVPEFQRSREGRAGMDWVAVVSCYQRFLKPS